jgi:hypothetical protein
MEILENKDSGFAVGGTGEIVVYQPDEITRLEVKVNEDTVWLTQTQIAQLFGVGQPAISKHLKNIFASGELDITAVHSILEYTAADGKSYKTGFYNLDAILSIGYRVNSRQATRFRQWANTVLKEYLIKGISLNARLLQLSTDIDRRLTTHAIKLNEHECRLKEQAQKIEFFIQSSLPPKQGIFFDGQIYDAYAFVAKLVRKATRRIVLIDNYIDDTVLTMLSKRADGVEAVIYTGKVSKQLQLDIDKHNAQYPPITVRTFSKAHDRFLIIDQTVYLIGASIKDLGKKWFGFTLLENTDAEELLGRM